MAPGLVQEWWVTRRSGYPVVGAVGVAGQAQGSRSFIRRVLHLDPCAWPASEEPADATGYPLPPHLSYERDNAPSCCPRAVARGQ
jgi:hypothetical protein